MNIQTVAEKLRNTIAGKEKFAELIVREAIEKIESIGFKSSNDIPFETTELFVSQIKQHFGVKE